MTSANNMSANLADNFYSRWNLHVCIAIQNLRIAVLVASRAISDQLLRVAAIDRWSSWSFAAISQEKTLQGIEKFDKSQLKHSQTAESSARQRKSVSRRDGSHTLDHDPPTRTLLQREAQGSQSARAVVASIDWRIIYYTNPIITLTLCFVYSCFHDQFVIASIHAITCTCSRYLS